MFCHLIGRVSYNVLFFICVGRVTMFCHLICRVSYNVLSPYL